MNCPDDHTFLRLDITGHELKLAISQKEMETLHKPILSRMSFMARQKTGRLIVFLAGPPGVGKSATAAIWAKLAEEYGEFVKIQVLPMDGFHLPNKVLEARATIIDGQAVSLRKVKGSPESYDLNQFLNKLKAVHAGQEVRWPVYDRTRHDPFPDALKVQNEGILIVEGNYLLLNEPGWHKLKGYADLTVFINMSEEMLRNDVIERHIRGGRSQSDALRHYDFNDRRNWNRVMKSRLSADITLEVRPGRQLELSASEPLPGGC